MTLPPPLIPGARRPQLGHEGIGVKALTLTPLPAFPADPEEGQLVILASDNALYQYKGGVWVPVGGSGFLTKAEADTYYRQKSTFRYEQQTPATLWTIAHGLNSMPVVVVQDSAGTTVEGDVEYVSLVTLRLHFSVAFSGVAYLA